MYCWFGVCVGNREGFVGGSVILLSLLRCCFSFCVVVLLEWV